MRLPPNLRWTFRERFDVKGVFASADLLAHIGVLTLVAGFLTPMIAAEGMTLSPRVAIRALLAQQVAQGTGPTQAVEELPPHQIESGLVTREELKLAERW